MQLADGLHRIDVPLGARTNALYVFDGGDAALLFDVGTRRTVPEVVLPYLARVGIDRDKVTWIVISHADVDHFGGLHSAQSCLPRAVSVAHHADAPLIERYTVYEHRRARGFLDGWGFDELPEQLAWARSVTQEGSVNLRVSGGESIRLGPERLVTLLHLPGHTEGHLAVHDPGNEAVAVADAVLSDAVVDVDANPVLPPTYRFVPEYLASIERLRELEPQLLLTSHYPTMDRAAAQKFFQSSAAFAARLARRVEAALAAAGPEGLNLAELVLRLDGSERWACTDATVHALAFPVVGHLEQLLAEGLADIRPARAGEPARISASDAASARTRERQRAAVSGQRT